MLSITVYCNCVETGKLRTQPKPHWDINVWNEEDGMVDVECSNDPADIADMHAWADSACSHPEFKAFYDYDFVSVPQAIGVRDEISKQGEFPLLLGNVFESAAHEHWLAPKDLPGLQAELARLDRNKLSDWVRNVIDKLSNAANVATEMQKSISF